MNCGNAKIDNVPMPRQAPRVTYIQHPKDAVELVIQFGLLPDGTTYPASVNLNAQAKEVTVQVTNADYRKVG